MTNPTTVNWPYPGSRWWRFDFHAHTPASSDYGVGPNQAELKARSQREWLMDFINAGIDCVAVTDHNCGDWIDPLKTELAKLKDENVSGAKNFHLFPGVELTINGAHFLAIFDPSRGTRTIQDLLAVAGCNKDPKNAAAYCSESIGKINEEIRKAEGLLIPAHVDDENTGFFKLQTNLSALDPILKLDGILAMEVRNPDFELPQTYRDAKLAWTQIVGSDAHHPVPSGSGTSMAHSAHPGSRYTWVKMAEPTLAALRLALIDGEGVSIRRSGDVVTGFQPFATPDEIIEEISIEKTKFMGNGRRETLCFTPWLNAIVGGRGTGKSSVLQFLRLAMRRDRELEQFPESSELYRNFEQFRHKAKKRTDDGVIKEDTRIKVVFRHQGTRYRLSWSASNETVVEEWDAATEDWNTAASQAVTDRFPVRLFSQGQIAALAGERSGALMELINQAVDYADWRARWDEAEREFLSDRTRMRELEGKLQSRDRIVGELEDVRRKLARFEDKEHAKVLKTYQAFRRQVREVEQQFNDGRNYVRQIEQLAEDIVPADVSEGVFPETDQNGAIARKHVDHVRDAIAQAVIDLKKLAVSLGEAVFAQEHALGTSEWQNAVDSSKIAFDSLVAELKEQGVDDPSEYGPLVQQRQRLEESLKNLDSLTESLAEVKQRSKAKLVRLADLRREITAKRRKFLTQTLADNLYVRINLQAYGRDHADATDSLREVLGIADVPDKFRRDIFDSDVEIADQKGIIVELLEDLPDDEETCAVELEERISRLRDELVAISGGGDASTVGGNLKNRLQNTFEGRPEFVDRILTWYPEDTLEVQYSPAGDGTKFRSILQGSAGQRAAAMLAFLLAYGDEPIVVDQPEDDLDNHLIYELVVKQIRANKHRRQIITVTHNPNIVVNGDAEMVHAMDFLNGQCRVAKKGGLQDQQVRKEICHVMEGGEKAFEERYRRIGKGKHHV